MADYDYKMMAAASTLALLDAQVERQRADLVCLRRELVMAQRELTSARRELIRVRLELDPARRNLANALRDWSNLQQDLKSCHHSDLLAENQQLSVAVELAEAKANTATATLKEMTQDAQRDPLTKTPNRALMLDRIESAIFLARRYHKRVGLVFIDFDHFKSINDSLGHHIGDAVLQLITRRLEMVIRNSDTVSRHSGDEFLVLLAEVGTFADATAIAEKMLSVLRQPAKIEHHELRLSASMGIAIYPDNATDPAGLIKFADEVMYRAKMRGGNCFELMPAQKAMNHG